MVSFTATHSILFQYRFFVNNDTRMGKPVFCPGFLNLHQSKKPFLQTKSGKCHYGHFPDFVVNTVNKEIGHNLPLK